MHSTWKAVPLVYLPARLWHYSGGLRHKIVTYFMLSLTAIGFDLAMPLVHGMAFNAIQDAVTSGMSMRVGYALAAMFGVNLLFWCFHAPSRVLEQDVAVRVRGQFLLGSLEKVFALPIPWHTARHSGETNDKVSRAASALQDFSEYSFVPLRMGTRFLAAIGVVWAFSTSAGAVITASSLIIIGVIVWFDRRIQPQLKAYNAFVSKTAATVQDYLTNIVTVISLRLEKRVLGEIRSRYDEGIPVRNKLSWMVERKWVVADSIMMAAIPTSLLAYTLSVEGAVKAGTLYVLFSYLNTVGRTVNEFNNIYSRMTHQGVLLGAVEPIEQDFDQIVAPTYSATLPSGWSTLEINNLTFWHDGAYGKGGVENVSFRLQRGRTTAIIGKSGAGKSTIMSLVRCLLKPTTVEVRCDGELLPEGLIHVAHRTTLIPQSPEIFAQTIRFNVSLGVDASDSAVMEAIRLAGFEEVLANLKDGLDSNLAERGVNISEGQQQRLALARGFFFMKESSSDILLLDEPTSSLDERTEWQLYQRILGMARDRCVVSVLHKMHLLPLFDEVVVLDQGQVVAAGPTRELIEAGEIPGWSKREANTDEVEADAMTTFG